MSISLDNVMDEHGYDRVAAAAARAGFDINANESAKAYHELRGPIHQSSSDDMGQELPSPDTKHFTVIVSIRCSLNASPYTVETLRQHLPLMVERYNDMLNNGMLPRPGGPGTFMLWHGHVFQDEMADVIPLYSTYPEREHELDPYTKLMHRELDASNPAFPVAIQYLTMGLAGFAIDINRWGSRIDGFYRWLMDKDKANKTNLAANTDLIHVVEPHVVDGTKSSCALYSGSPPDYLLHFRGKYVLSNRLQDLVDRSLVKWRKLHFPSGEPIPGPSAYELRLGEHVRALEEENLWRIGGLGHTTVPACEGVTNRNSNRNRNRV